jgi:hypothetical protein
MQYPTDENYKSWRSIPIFESIYVCASTGADAGEEITTSPLTKTHHSSVFLRSGVVTV